MAKEKKTKSKNGASQAMAWNASFAPDEDNEWKVVQQYTGISRMKEVLLVVLQFLWDYKQTFGSYLKPHELRNILYGAVQVPSQSVSVPQAQPMELEPIKKGKNKLSFDEDE